MTTLRQAAEEALEALKRTHYLLISEKILDQERLNENFTAAEALRKALAEPECKTHPDAPHGFCRNASASEDRYVCECEYWNPPHRKWVGLTDDDIDEAARFCVKSNQSVNSVIRAIEAKLKEKNK